MSGVRAPTIAGVGGGVATTTLAVALRGEDAGTAAGGADILACRARPDSLHRAAAVLDRAGPGPRPVLAVTLDGARAPRGPVRAHLDRLAKAASAVVLLPDVGRWRRIGDPLPEVATVLLEPAEQVPRPLRAYAAALRELAAAAAASGRLDAAPRWTGRPAPGAGATGPAGTGAAVGGAPRPDVRPWPEPATVAGRAAVGASGRVPTVVGTFRPVVGRVVDPGARAVATTPLRPGARPRTVGGAVHGVERAAPTRAVERGTAARGVDRATGADRAADAPQGRPRRPRGVRIVSPSGARIAGSGGARSTAPPGTSAARPPGEAAQPSVDRIVQVG